MKKIIILPLLLSLAACQTTGEIPVTTISERAPHDELNDIILPPSPNVSTPKLDIARDAAGNPLADSNIYRGYDYDNYTKVESNEYKLRVYVQTLLGLIQNENTRRQQNREENKKWRDEAAKKKAEAAK